MKEKAKVLEEQKELNEVLLDKISGIRNFCLEMDIADIFEKKSPRRIHLYKLCQQLVVSIDSPEECKRVFNELPYTAGKPVHEQYIAKFIASLVGKISSMPELLTTLADYPELQEQIIKACVGKNIKNVEDLRAVLEYANNSELQLVAMEAIGQSKLDSFIKSVGDLRLILEVLPEDVVPTLGKALVEQFTPLFRTRKQLFDSLQVFSKNPRLQELLVETLDITGRLARLSGSGYKTAALKLFEDRQIFYDIVKTAFTAKPNCLLRFFQNVFHESSTGGQAQGQTPTSIP